METLWQDVRLAARMLARNPAFTAVALLTLALGIGPNTAVFSVIEAVLLTPPPYDDPATIVSLSQISQTPQGPQTWPGIYNDVFEDWRQTSQTLQHMAFYGWHWMTLTGGDEPRRLSGAHVSPALFPLLRVQPMIGRVFTPEDEPPGNDRVVLLAHDSWQKYFGGDRALVGRPITLDGNPYTVVGVMPPGFAFPDFPDEDVEFWVPFSLPPSGARHMMVVPAIARLKPGIAVAAAQAEGNAVLERSLQDMSMPKGARFVAKDVKLRLVTLQEHTVGKVRPALLMMLGAVGLVLLIACANVTNLLLTRAADRQRELSIRAALGAGRGRLLRQALAESLLLGLLGGAAGLLLGVWGIYLLPYAQSPSIPRLEEAGLNLPVLAFTFVVALLTSLLCGLAPALRSTRGDLHARLKEGTAQGTAGFRLWRSHRTRSLLAVSEVALALVLLVGAGLLATSFLRLVSQHLGYDPEGVLTVQMESPRARYPQPELQAAFYERVLEGVRALPDVRSAGVATRTPLSRRGGISMGFDIPGRPAPSTEKVSFGAGIRLISSGFFDALGMKIREGRDFGPQDSETGAPVVIINESLAKHYFGSDNPVGQQINLRGLREIIAVIRDVKPFGFDSVPSPEVFLPYRQFAPILMRLMSGATAELWLAVRTAGDPIALVSPVRSQIRAADSQLAIYNITTMERQLALTTARPRFYASLLGIFATFALALAAVGIYGILAYDVAQCTREIGIRMALGARRSNVLAMVLRQGMTLAAAGITLGLAGAWAASRLVSSMLFGTSATDPTIYGALALALAAIAVVAAYIPARRATAIDPAIALRHE